MAMEFLSSISVSSIVSGTTVCGSSKVCSPIIAGTTCATAPIVLGSTYVCSPTITGSTKVCSPTVYATTCFCSVAGCGTAVDWIASSDCRVKTNIKPISGALSTVLNLQGVSYQLCNDEKQENHLGLIAQDVIKILPEVVSHSIPSEDDFKYDICDDKLGLKYDKLSAVLIEAIKEQQIQIKEQEKQLHCLCLEINYMRNSNT